MKYRTVVEDRYTPDFNRFDREFNKVTQAAGKLRWLLWDIHSAASTPTSAEEGEG